MVIIVYQKESKRINLQESDFIQSAPLSIRTRPVVNNLPNYILLKCRKPIFLINIVIYQISYLSILLRLLTHCISSSDNSNQIYRNSPQYDLDQMSLELLYSQVIEARHNPVIRAIRTERIGEHGEWS